MKFTLDPPPDTNDTRVLRQWVVDQFERLGPAVNYQGLSVQYSAPDKVIDGMLVYADGTQWDPGSGEGVYARYNGAWNKL